MTQYEKRTAIRIARDDLRRHEFNYATFCGTTFNATERAEFYRSTVGVALAEIDNLTREL